MNRFMYYLVLVNMIANMISSVPKILLDERMDGAITSMIISIILGTFLVYIFVKFFNRFPGKNLPDLLKEHMSKWIYFPFLLFITSFWFTGGLITIVTYSFMLKRFMTPDMSLIWIATSFLIVISFGILMKTQNILYTLENVLVFSTPIVVYMIVKAFSSEGFEWDFVREAVMYVNHLPSYNAFSSSFFIFGGVMNLIIFNKVFTEGKQHITWKHLWLIAAIGTSILGATYFLPLGLNGFDYIHELVYPAVTSSDTLRMKYGIIERVIYVFMPFFLAISFLSVLIHWHVAIEACKNIIWFKRFEWRKVNLTPYIYLIIFWVITLKLITSLSEYTLLLYSGYFFNAVPFQTIVFFITFWFIRRRAMA